MCVAWDKIKTYGWGYRRRHDICHIGLQCLRRFPKNELCEVPWLVYSLALHKRQVPVSCSPWDLVSKKCVCRPPNGRWVWTAHTTGLIAASMSSRRHMTVLPLSRSVRAAFLEHARGISGCLNSGGALIVSTKALSSVESWACMSVFDFLVLTVLSEEVSQRVSAWTPSCVHLCSKLNVRIYHWRLVKYMQTLHVSCLLSRNLHDVNKMKTHIYIKMKLNILISSIETTIFPIEH